MLSFQLSALPTKVERLGLSSQFTRSPAGWQAERETPGVPCGRGRERIGGIYSTRAEHVDLLALRLDASRREPDPLPVVRALVASDLHPRLDSPAPIL